MPEISTLMPFWYYIEYLVSKITNFIFLDEADSIYRRQKLMKTQKLLKYMQNMHFFTKYVKICIYIKICKNM